MSVQRTLKWRALGQHAQAGFSVPTWHSILRLSRAWYWLDSGVFANHLVLVKVKNKQTNSPHIQSLFNYYLSPSCFCQDCVVSIDQSFKDQHHFGFEAGSHYASQAALELMILLPPPPTSGRIDLLASNLSKCLVCLSFVLLGHPLVVVSVCLGYFVQFVKCLVCWHCCK